MCCDEQPAAAAMEASMAKMFRVFTTTPGARVLIGKFGEASNKVPAIVPEEVAQELQRDMDGEPAVEADEEAGTPAREERRALGRLYRIEPDEPPPAPPAKDAEKPKETAKARGGAAKDKE